MAKTIGFWIALVTCVLPVWIITPASFVFLSYNLFRVFFNTSNSYSTLYIVLAIYSFVETLFYFWHKTLQRNVRARGIPPKDHLKRTIAVVTKILEGVDTSALVELRESFRLWFHNAPFASIRRLNVMDWMSWSVYSKHFDELNGTEKLQCEAFVDSIETRTNYKFPLGRNPEVSCMRLTLDPLVELSRPLAFYIFVASVDFFMTIQLWFWGFHEEHAVDLSYYVKRPKNQMPAHSKDDGALPIVFLHGIGLGLVQYYAFIAAILNSKISSNKAIILVKQPHISMGLHRKSHLSLELSSKQSIVKGLKAMVDRECPQGAQWIGHSNGTIVAGWFAREFPNLVKRVAFVDPVCLQLFNADVCYNFVYRKPMNGIQLLMYYFVSREVGVARNISRNFWWTENILFPNEIPNITSKYHVSFYLGTTDSIVNTKNLRQYLLQQGVPANQIKSYEGYPHGKAILANTQGFKDLMQWISMKASV